MSQRPCLGVDLGTTCSTIGLVRWGAPELLPVEGTTLLPSVVFWSPAGGEPLVGPRAVHSLETAPSRGVVAAKRELGSDHRWSIGDRQVSARQVSALILGRLVDGAWMALGWRPERLLITVPAWFTHAQRVDTRRAAEDTGVEVMGLVNEPTAAALAHTWGGEASRRLLVYDFGGGTFDVSLMQQEGTRIEVLSSHGDTRLGGEDIDSALVIRVLQRLGDPGLARAIRDDRAASLRLKLAVEQSKRELGQAASAMVRVPFVLDQRHLEVPLQRADLDDAVQPLIDRTLDSVEQCLGDTARDQVDELLLIGGSTLLPQVWRRLRQATGLEGSHAIPPRKAVGLGAAIRAAMLDGTHTEGVLVDVAPYALSVGVIAPPEGPAEPRRFRCRVITPRNVQLPARHTEIFATGHPLQTELHIPVFQGSSVDPRQNAFLGEVLMDGLPPPPPGQASRPIGVEFRHDLDGTVGISVTDLLTGRRARGQVAADGDEQASLRAAWLQRLSRQGYVFATDPPPTG